MYGSSEYRDWRNKEILEWVTRKSQIIDNIPDNYLKALCYFSLIENFSQEYSNYPLQQQAESFCKFVSNFSTSYSFLTEYDPVTLYYDFEAELKGSFVLSFLDYGVNYNPDHAVKYGKAPEMIKALEMYNVKKRIERHKFVRLLYSMRSKLSHELFNQHAMLATDLHLLPDYPYYVPCSRSYDKEDKRVRDEIWELVVPVGFIRNLALECINNYLNFCLANRDDPFENNRLDRKSNAAWYD